MPSKILSVERMKSGDVVISVAYPSGTSHAFTLSGPDAAALSNELFDATHPTPVVDVRAEIASLRRDQQQIVTALQEIARKAKKLDMIEVSTPITIHGDSVMTKAAADLLTAMAVHKGVEPC